MPIIFFGGSSSSSLATAITARDLVTRALKLLGVLAAGEPLKAQDAADGFDTLNDLIDGLNTERLTIPSVTRTLQTLTTAASYTIGTGATWNQAWPHALEAAGVVVTTGSDVAEYPVKVLTDAGEWARVRVKAQTAPWPLIIYYDHAFTDGIGTIEVWPVSDGSQSIQLALYTPSWLVQFAALDTTYAFPPGVPKMLRYLLAQDCAPNWGVPVPETVARIALESKGNVKRANFRPRTLRLDGSVPGLNRGTYDVRSDSYLP